MQLLRWKNFGFAEPSEDHRRLFTDLDALQRQTDRAPTASGAVPTTFAHDWGIWRQLWWLPVLGLAVSVGLAVVVFRLEASSDEARFSELASQRIIAVKANLDTAIDRVNLLVGHFSVTPLQDTNRAGFHRMVTPTLAARTFIQAFSWDPRVPAEQKDGFERQARLDGSPGFAIFERDSRGQSRAVDARDDYIPVFYIEPMAKNGAAVGFDLASDPVRRQALDAGRDSAMPQATGRIKLVQETGNQFGVLVLAPVYGVGPPTDPMERRRALIGFISGVFRIGDLIAQSQVGAAEGATGSPSSLIDLHLYDLSNPQSENGQLYPVAPEVSPEQLMHGLFSAVTFMVAGRAWQLVATPGPAFKTSLVSHNALATLLAGLLATSFLVYRQKNSIDRVKSATQFARQLADAKQQLSEAQRVARLASMAFDPLSGTWALGEGMQEMRRHARSHRHHDTRGR
jgi:CHASE1-domain containing sensor protein